MTYVYIYIHIYIYMYVFIGVMVLTVVCDFPYIRVADPSVVHLMKERPASLVALWLVRRLRRLTHHFAKAPQTLTASQRPLLHRLLLAPFSADGLWVFNLSILVVSKALDL